MQTMNTIKNLARLFDENKVRYHFDGSTSLFIDGMSVEMDDIDICFPSGTEHDVRDLFLAYEPSDITEEKDYGLKHFKFNLEGEKIHCLFYSGTYEAFSSEEIETWIDGQRVIYKSLDFYLRHISPDSDLARQIRARLNQNQ